MKILVFADSHGDVETMERAITYEKPATIIHLGDHLQDALRVREQYPKLLVFCVSGNTDVDEKGERELCKEIDGHTIFLTHGDRYGVDQNVSYIEKLFGLCTQHNADILLFGHSHQPFAYCRNGVWIINPGRIGKTRGK